MRPSGTRLRSQVDASHTDDPQQRGRCLQGHSQVQLRLLTLLIGFCQWEFTWHHWLARKGTSFSDSAGCLSPAPRDAALVPSGRLLLWKMLMGLRSGP